jgi:hypothetical protein
MYVVSFKAKCNVALYKKAYNVRYRRLWMLFVLLHVFRVNSCLILLDPVQRKWFR